MTRVLAHNCLVDEAFRRAVEVWELEWVIRVATA